MFFFTDSKLSHVYWGPKRKKVHGTFGVGWKHQGCAVTYMYDFKSIFSGTYFSAGIWILNLTNVLCAPNTYSSTVFTSKAALIRKKLPMCIRQASLMDGQTQKKTLFLTCNHSCYLALQFNTSIHFEFYTAMGIKMTSWEMAVIFGEL